MFVRLLPKQFASLIRHCRCADPPATGYCCLISLSHLVYIYIRDLQALKVTMAQAMRLTLAALVVCAAFVAPAAGRQLKQTGNNLDFPGCSFLSDSEIFRNPDYSSLAAALQASGLNETLSNLTGYHTLFAPTNEAFAEFLAAANITAQDALSSNLNEIVLASHVVPGVVPGELLVSNC